MPIAKTRLDKILDLLQKQGLSGTIDDAERVNFKKDNGWYIIQLYENDSTYYRFLYPNFFKTTDENEVKALRAINRVNVTTRIVKLIHYESAAWVAVESFHTT
jgi:hypothetical protein